MTTGDDITDNDASGAALDDAFVDAALRRALDHAPDLAAQPDWRLRKAILQAGRDAVMPAATTSPRDAGRVSWWQRLWGGGGGSRMPWNAAFATVLVATLVTVMWRSEPVPDARLDGEAQVAAPPVAAPVPVPAPIAPSSPATEATTPELERKPAPPSEATAAPAVTSVPEKPSLPEAAPDSRDAGRAQRERSALASQKEVNRAEETTAAPPSQPQARAQPAPSPFPAPAAPAPLREAAPAAATEEATNATRERSAVLRQAQKSRAEEAALPPTAAAAARADVAPPSVADAQRAPALRNSLEAPPAASAARSPPAAAAPAAAAPDSAARRAAPSAAAGAGARDESTEPPTFAALAQWDRLVIADAGGARRTLSRDEATELRALMGSVAISAVEARRFAGPVTWRLTMERNGQVLAVLELGNQQVRWREGTVPAATGVPNAGALSALRAALSAAATAQPEAGAR